MTESFRAAAAPKTFEGDGESILRLVEQTKTFSVDTPGSRVHRFLEDHQSAEGVVVLQDDHPVGLVMRHEFYQKLGSPYGRALFLNRPIRLLMSENPLVVDASVDIGTISLLAMNRDRAHLYDMVIVTENEEYMGVVSVQRFMIELARHREKEIELLRTQQEILHRANQAEIRHREQIEAKNAALKERGDAVKNLLDNAGQGFLSFGADLIVSDEYSLECVQLFRGPVGGKDFLTLMERHVGPEVRETMATVFGSVLAGARGLKQKVYLSLLPEELVVYDRNVHVEYKVISPQGESRFMLVLTDITAQKRLEKRMAEERSNLVMVVKALNNRSELVSAVRSLKTFFSEDAPSMVRDAPALREGAAELFRMVHTFKGDFGQLGLHRAASHLHAMEDSLARRLEQEETDREELLAEVEAWSPHTVLGKDLEILTANLGKTFLSIEERVSVSREVLKGVEERVAGLPQSADRDDILRSLRELRLEDVRTILRGFGETVSELAERLEKGVEPMSVTGDKVLLERNEYDRFFKSLVHVFRNMVDHGIEPMDERMEQGKTELGRVSCTVSRSGQGLFTISIADDGRGIDTDRVLARAVDKGIVPPGTELPREEIFDLLFADDLSTRETVTMLSGRGVGLSAVRMETERLGGKVEVDSSEGRGTTFRFVLPGRA